VNYKHEDFTHENILGIDAIYIVLLLLVEVGQHIYLFYAVNDV